MGTIEVAWRGKGNKINGKLADNESGSKRFKGVHFLFSSSLPHREMTEYPKGIRRLKGSYGFPGPSPVFLMTLRDSRAG